ncbi:MAG: 4Fe-4S dicluster domain-containing protein, partial [Vulcanimicrobiaceae bacterium]
YRKVEPFFVGDSPSFAEQTPQPLRVDPAQPLRQSANRAIDCISCGACYSACPTVAANPAYLGPAALNRAFALAADERDRDVDRLKLVSGPEGAYGCRSVGNCVSVCPAGVAPLAAITLLRRGKTAGAT